MSGNKNSGRKPKPNGVRTSIFIDGPTMNALQFMAAKEGRTQSAIVQDAIEEYFLNHYEKKIEEKINATNSDQA